MASIRLVCCCLVLQSFQTAVLAAEADSAPAARTASPWSLSVLGGFRDGGRFALPDADSRVDIDGAGSFLVAVNLRQSTDRYYELFYGRQSTDLGGEPDLDLSIEYLHVGGLLEFPQGGFSTHFGGGLGVTRIDVSGRGLGSETRPSLSLNGGIQVPLGERLSFRLETRGYLTLTDGDRELFCQVDGGAECLVAYRGDTLFQIEAVAGLRFRF